MEAQIGNIAYETLETDSPVSPISCNGENFNGSATTSDNETAVNKTIIVTEMTSMTEIIPVKVRASNN